MYRPEGWESIHIVYDECVHDWLHIGDLKSDERQLVEASADAMLEKLRKKGIKIKSSSIRFDFDGEILVPANMAGTIVFIPNEVK